MKTLNKPGKKGMLIKKRVIHDSQGRKNISVIYKERPSFLREESKLDQVSCIFYKLPSTLLIFSDKNKMAELVAGMLGNCSNRLCQLLFHLI